MKKVIIIGAGDIGGRAFKFIGPEYVAYFADNKKYGQEYYDRKIIPVDTLKAYEGQYVFLLALSNHLEELETQLKELEIEYYYFREEVYYCNAINQLDYSVFNKISLYECVKKYASDETYITGEKCSSMSRFISEITGFPYITYNEAYDKKSCTFFLDKTDSEKCNRIKNNNSVYSINCTDDTIPIYDSLAKFKYCHKNRRCFIIGNGPSLRIDDLDKLHDNNELSIGLNVIHKLYTKTQWRPNYVCVSDMLVIMQNYGNIIRYNNNCDVFMSDVRTLIYNFEKAENEHFFHELHVSKDEELTPYFAEDIINGIYNGSTVSYIALQICVYMGFNEIYLLGMDCSNWSEHFSKNYWKNDEIFNSPNEKRIFKGYIEAKKICEQKGIKIYNATRGGKLDVFERIDFDNLF